MAYADSAHSAFAAAHSTAPPATATHTQRHVYKVSAPGTYAVIVSLAPRTQPETVDVYVGQQHDKGAQVGSTGEKLEFMATITRPRLIVRVVSHGAAVPFSAARALQPTTVAEPVAPPPITSPPTAPSSGPYNTLIWSDEFDGPAGSPPNPASWTPDSGGGCGPGTLSTNTPNVANASLDGSGQLGIADLGPTASPPYSTAQIDTDGHFSFTYGRIEARIDVAAGQGICSAFWMVADDGEQLGWPNGGEIDVMEAIGDIPTQSNGFLHGPITDNANDQQWNSIINSVTPLAGGFHTYGVIWKPGSITWTLDGVPFGTATPAKFPSTAKWVFDGHPFHIVLDEAVGGWPGNPNASTVFPATMQVDWVRVYQ